MKWNWQNSDWPNWLWDSSALASAEGAYLFEAGRLAGIWQQIETNLAVVQANTYL